MPPGVSAHTSFWEWANRPSVPDSMGQKGKERCCSKEREEKEINQGEMCIMRKGTGNGGRDNTTPHWRR